MPLLTVTRLWLSALSECPHCPLPTPHKDELRKQSSQQQPEKPTQQCSPTEEIRPDRRSLASASRPKSAPRLRRPGSNSQPARGTASASATIGGKHASQAAGVGGRCRAAAGTTPTRDGWVGAARSIAGNTETGYQVESRGNAGAGKDQRFLAVRPKTDAKSSRQKDGTTSSRTTISPCAAASGKRRSPAVTGGAVANRDDAESAEAALAGRIGGKEDNVAGIEILEETSKPMDGIDNTARDGCVHRSGGRGGGSGRTRGYLVKSSGRHDSAPKVLLARETEAALRREQRVAAAKEKEEEELRLSSSFRAKEVRQGLEVHVTIAIEWRS